MDIVGKLTHKDYQLIIPMIDNAIKGIKQPQLNILIDALEFDGWEPLAIWDDFKFGLSHYNQFEKIAFVGNKKWEEYAIKISNWFMIGGDIIYFETIDDATQWIYEVTPKLDSIQKELKNRKDEIENELEMLFKANLKITDWDIPEANDQEAAEILLDILYKKLDSIKKDVENKKYTNY
jgi:hypothetical protein